MSNKYHVIIINGLIGSMQENSSYIAVNRNVNSRASYRSEESAQNGCATNEG